MVALIGAALLPKVRTEAAAMDPRVPSLDGLRPVAMGLAAAAVGIGLALQHAAAPDDRNPLAVRGFAPAGSMPLMVGGG